MAEYYAVERSPEYLAHYGIKGMRWGVRKAIERGNSKRLARHWAKAQKKLAKLNKKADVNASRLEAEKYDKASKGAKIAGRAALGVAALGSGVNLGIQHVLKPKNEARLYDLNMKKADKQSLMELQKNPEKFFYGTLGYSYDPRVEQMKTAYQSNAKDVAKLNTQIASAEKTGATYSRIQRGINPLIPIGIGGALGGYGYSAYAKRRANNARSRMAGEGHKKAVAERDAWQKEMNRAFAETQYAKKPRHKKKRK